MENPTSINESQDVELYETTPIKRGGKWKIQIPREFEKFRIILDKVLPIALEDVHPIVRQADTFVYFADQIVNKNGFQHEVFGYDGMAELEDKPGKKLNILISSQLPNLNADVQSIGAVGVLLHELFEADYWMKSKHLANKPIQASLNQEDYNQTDHEVVAEQRTAICFQKALGAKIKLTKTGAKIVVPKKYSDRL